MMFFRRLQLNWNAAFWPIFSLCSILYLIPIWSVKYLPMVDLPEHAALLSIWENFNDPAFEYQNVLQINWFTPYIIPMGLCRLFLILMDVLPAIKLALSLAIIGFPLSLILLLRQTKGDRWLSLIGFPITFGFGFYWGFFTYLCSIPIAALTVWSAMAYHLEPKIKKGSLFLMANMVLFFSHGITFLVCNLAIVSLFLKISLRRWWPLLTSGLVTGIWYLTLQKSGNSVSSSVQWEFNPVFRLKEFPSLLMNVHPEALPYFTALILIALPFLSAKYPLKTTWPRAAMFSIALSLYLFSPSNAMETAFVFHRLGSVTFLFFVLLFPLTENPLRIVLSRIFITLTVFFWSTILTLRFVSFNAVARDFDGILEAIKPGHFLVDAVEKKNSDLQGDSFLHFSGWYTTFKGGLNNNSFFYIYKQTIRFTKFVNLNKLDQSWERPFEKYFLFRQLEEPALSSKLDLVTKSGLWWLYKERKNGLATHP